jgi:uncharacterized SAM-binding protein YcdF (DUF218 family)
MRAVSTQGLFYGFRVDRLVQRLGAVGADGLFTLFLSSLVLVATFGLSLGWPLRHVVRMARSAPVMAATGSMLVVLGMRLDKGTVTDDYARRLERAIRLYRQDDKRTILVVGGLTGSSIASEAATGCDYLTSRGVRAEQILLEDASRDTLENLRNARCLMKSNGVDRFTLISSRCHLARCRIIAQGLGLNPDLCGAEDVYRLEIAGMPLLLLEAFYIHWYYTGAIWSRLTRNNKSLERIS